MNKTILNELTTSLINDGYEDLKFLIDTIEKYKVNVDDILKKHQENFGEVKVTQVNYLTYTTLQIITSEFIKANKELFEKHSDEYSIYNNYSDSWIWWADQEVQDTFENLK